MARTLFSLFIMTIPILLFSQDKDDDIAFDAAFKRMALKFSSSAEKLKNKTVAVYGFDVNGRPNDSFASYATEKITHEMVERGKVKVVERSHIDRVLREQQFSLSGAVDADNAARIGKLLSVDAVIIGTIRVTDTGIEFIVRMVQSESGVILTSANERLKSVSAASETQDIQKDSGETSVVKLTLNKNSYSAGESITVTFSGMKGSAFDWVTLVKSTDPDSTYGEWTYTNGAKKGSYTFRGVDSGDYEVRAYFDWPAGGYIVKKRIKLKVR